MKKLLIVFGLVAILAAGALYVWLGRERPALAPVAQPQPAMPTDPGPPPARHPPPQPSSPASPEVAQPPPPLPALGPDSDPVIGDALAALRSDDDLPLPLANDFVRRLVVTVDNLPRDRVPVRIRPLAPVPGALLVEGDEDSPILSPDNASRYAPLVRIATSMPTAALVDVYARYYPLFQQAYVELGYPDGHFNDRLIEVIDHLLDAPEPVGRLALERPHVMYKFADPQLEALSPGQKLMVRIGADHARELKDKLRELRDALVASPAP